MNLYIAYCPNCLKATKHYCSIASRRRGMKLVCLPCGKIRGQYTKNPVRYQE